MSDEEIIEKAINVSLVAMDKTNDGLVRDRTNTFLRQEKEGWGGRKQINENYGIFATSLDLLEDGSINVPFTWWAKDAHTEEKVKFSYYDPTHIKMTPTYPQNYREMDTIIICGQCTWGELTSEVVEYTINLYNLVESK